MSLDPKTLQLVQAHLKWKDKLVAFHFLALWKKIWVAKAENFRGRLKDGGCMQEECISACGRAVCKHVRAYLHARPDWTEGLLQPALSYLGAVPVPVLALILSQRVRPDDK